MNLFLGFEFAPIDGWEAVMPAPQAPSNYKDPVKITAYIDKEIEKLRNGKAATEPLCGSLRRAVVIDAAGKDGRIRPQFDSGTATNAGVQLIEFLLRHGGANRVWPTTLKLFGYKIHRAMQLCAIEIMTTRPLTAGEQWLVGQSEHASCNKCAGPFIDPVSIIFGSSDVNIAAAAKRLQLAVPPDDANAAAYAEFSCALAKAMGF